MGVLDRVGAEALGALGDDEAARTGWTEAYRGGGGEPGELLAPRRDGGCLEAVFRERADRLGVRAEEPGSDGTGLHPEILDTLRKQYGLSFRATRAAASGGSPVPGRSGGTPGRVSPGSRCG
jgi:hypothetical protein